MTDNTQELYIPLRIQAIKQEIAGVKTFILEPVNNNAISYKAGQFLTFAIQHHHKEERRSFSISSSPTLQEPLAITVKRVDNGVYSRLLIDKARQGDILYSTGASGLFVLPDNISYYEQLFFFAAGIGITPIFSLLKDALYTQPHLHITLVYSSSNSETTVFYKELVALRNEFPGRLHLEFLFSTSFDLSRARLSKLLLPVLLKELSKTEKEKTLFYTCGPFSYMRMVLLTLEEQGVPAENVKKENFNTEARPIIRIAPPDTTAHRVFIKTGNKEFSFSSQYPDTILHAAKKNGIQLPYSCETGRCGSCAIRCANGKVWMSNNEVLTDADIAAGKILTCVAYPIDGDITLIIN